jgi:23S rRNA (pseudouridine1915-N3)-methyltransferase
VRLQVWAVGRMKDPGLAALCDEFARRTRPWHALTLHEARTPGALRDAWRAAGAPWVLLDERGDQPSSPELAQWLRQWQHAGVPTVHFAIGDADGWSDADRARADRVLALSRLTLPHRMARLVLVEQLYRAATILAGHPYHHG